jgi:hypothetical protein
MTTTEALNEIREIINKQNPQNIETYLNDSIRLRSLISALDRSIVENRNNLPDDWK